MRDDRDTWASFRYHRTLRVLRALTPNIAWFFLGQLTSRIGDALRLVALPWLLIEMTHSADTLAVMGIAAAVPFILFGFAGGVFADRHDRRRIMITADAARALILAMVPVFSVLGLLAPWHIYVATFLASVAAIFFYPAETALVPMIAPAKDLVTLNATFSLLRQSVALVGSALAGVTVAAFGPAPALAVDAVSFAVSAAAIGAIRVDNDSHVGVDRAVSLLSDVRAGVGFIVRNGTARGLVVVTLVMNGAHLPLMGTFLPLFVNEALLSNAAGFGSLMAADSAGLITGWLVLARLGGHKPPWILLGIGTLCMGIGLVAFSFACTLSVALGIAFAVGVAGSATNPPATALLQTTIPSEMRGRVASALMISGYLLSSVAIAIGPALIARVGLRGYYLGNALVIAILGLAVLRARGFVRPDVSGVPGRLI